MATPVDQASFYLLQFIAGLVTFLLLIRFLIRATNVDWRNPIVLSIARFSNPIVAPFGVILPSKGRWDFAALAAAFVVQILLALAIGWLASRVFSINYVLIFALTEVLNFLLDLMFWLIIIRVILSWVVQSYNPNLAIFYQLTSPILHFFQRLIPPIGGLDISPIFAILAIKLTQILVVGTLVQMAY